MFAIIAAVVVVMTQSAPSPSPPSVEPASAVAYGEVTVRMVGCEPEKDGNVVALVNHKAATFLEFSSNLVRLDAPQGFDTVVISVGHCKANFDALVLKGFERDVVVSAETGVIDPNCCHETVDEYGIQAGHLMGSLPDVSGLSIELIGDKNITFSAEIQRGAFYFDLVGVGHYKLQVSGRNWHKTVSELDITDTNSFGRSSLIEDISRDAAWGGYLDRF
jgi:hypothetical protein